MDLRQLIERLKQLSDIFYDNGIEDIYTNSKIYEVLMSEQFGHKIINGHVNTLDAIQRAIYMNTNILSCLALIIHGHLMIFQMRQSQNYIMLNLFISQ